MTCTKIHHKHTHIHIYIYKRSLEVVYDRTYVCACDDGSSYNCIYKYINNKYKKVSNRQNAQASAVAKHFGSGSIDAVVIQAGWDATPQKCAFGSLTSAISPHARYLVKEEFKDGTGRVRWRAVPIDEYIALGRRALPKHGTVELLAQNLTVHTLRSHGSHRCVDTQQIVVAPKVVQSSGASSVWAALEDGGLSIEKINELPGYVFLSESPDAASANIRLMAQRRESLGSRVLYDPNVCCVHGLHRIVVGSTGEEKLCGDVYAVHYVCSMPAHSARMARELRRHLQRTFFYNCQCSILKMIPKGILLSRASPGRPRVRWEEGVCNAKAFLQPG